MDDARILAQNLGIQYDVIPIQPMFVTAREQLKNVFAGRAEDTAEENIQARLRGVILMAMSNKFGSLLLTTGNKSELAVGYCTLYGDMCGGLAVISDVPKTMVYRIARWVNREREIIPAAPSRSRRRRNCARTRPTRIRCRPTTCSTRFWKRTWWKAAPRRKSSNPVSTKPTVRRVVRLINLNEYKRRQAAPGLKVTSKAFGVGRRVPVARRYWELDGGAV